MLGTAGDPEDRAHGSADDPGTVTQARLPASRMKGGNKPLVLTATGFYVTAKSNRDCTHRQTPARPHSGATWPQAFTQRCRAFNDLPPFTQRHPGPPRPLCWGPHFRSAAGPSSLAPLLLGACFRPQGLSQESPCHPLSLDQHSTPCM